MERKIVVEREIVDREKDRKREREREREMYGRIVVRVPLLS